MTQQQQQQQPVPPTVGDKTVPDSIHSKILELKEIETRLGHLPSETFAVSDLHKRYNDPSQLGHATLMEQRTEILFREIAGDLSDCGWNHSEISEAINQVVRYEGGPKYCSAEEVSEVLE